MTNQFLRRIEDHLWPHGFKRDIWMIVDAAGNPSTFSMLQERHLEHYCLYNGVLPLALQVVAPYLVQLDYNDAETRRFLQHAFGFGVLVKCSAHPNALRRHLRTFLRVREPGGGRLVFRYYDPRVLRIYLPTCTVEELRLFFGPIERFWIVDDLLGLLDYSIDQDQLIESRLVLGGTESILRRTIEPPIELLLQDPPGGTENQRPLAIRRSQLAAMQPLAEVALEARIKSHLNTYCAVSHLTPTNLDLRVKYAIGRARDYQLRTECAITTFVSLMFTIGPNFDDEISIRSIFLENSLPEPARLQNLILNVSPETWSVAETKCRVELWPYVDQ